MTNKQALGYLYALQNRVGRVGRLRKERFIMTCEPMFLASGSLANMVLLFYRQVFYCVKAVINHLDSCTVFPTYHLQKRKKKIC